MDLEYNQADPNALRSDGLVYMNSEDEREIKKVTDHTNYNIQLREMPDVE